MEKKRIEKCISTFVGMQISHRVEGNLTLVQFTPRVGPARYLLHIGRKVMWSVLLLDLMRSFLQITCADRYQDIIVQINITFISACVPQQHVSPRRRRGLCVP